MDIMDKAKALRKELKALGHNNKKISVTVRDYSAINVKIKDVSIYIKDIEAIANTYKNVSYDARSGEVLAGGNDYVFTSYDHDAMRTAKETKFAEAERLLKNCLPNDTFTHVEYDEYTIIYKNFTGCHHDITCIKNDDDNNKRQEITHIANSKHDIAEALVIFDSFISSKRK